MNAANLGDKFIGWARGAAFIRVVLLIGSRARGVGEHGLADGNSDWDFQIVTTECAIFSNSKWLAEVGVGEPIAYIARVGRLGGSTKISMVFSGGELDIVIIPAREFGLLLMLYRFGCENIAPRAVKGLRDLSAVWRGGVIVLKGSSAVVQFVRNVRSKVDAGRLDDNAILQIAEGFVCDYVSIRRKLERGEVIAAQRWLHLHLGEANLMLLHELRQRGGLTSFPDARRVEFHLSSEELKLISIEMTLERKSIESALCKSMRTCMVLVDILLQGRWHWPELPSSLRIEELRDDVL